MCFHFMKIVKSRTIWFWYNTEQFNTYLEIGLWILEFLPNDAAYVVFNSFIRKLDTIYRIIFLNTIKNSSFTKL